MTFSENLLLRFKKIVRKMMKTNVGIIRNQTVEIISAILCTNKWRDQRREEKGIEEGCKKIRELEGVYIYIFIHKSMLMCA